MSKSNDSPIENGDKRNSKGQFGEGNQFSKGRGRPKGSPSIPDILRSDEPIQVFDFDEVDD